MGGGAAARPVGAVKRLVALVLALAAAPSAAAAPLTVHARFDDASVQFGDVVHARVTVIADRSVRAGSIRVIEDLAPLTITSAMQTERAGSVLEVTRTALCVTAPCVAATFPAFRPVVVTASLQDGRTVRATARWPQLVVRGRVTAADLARARPPFRASVTPPQPSYRVAPSTLSSLFIGLAVLLGAAAVALALSAARGLRRRAAVPVGDPLERALRLVREAESRPASDRRRAAGLLARLLRDRSERLAGSASELAWAKPQPKPEALEVLADDVERTAGS